MPKPPRSSEIKILQEQITTLEKRELAYQRRERLLIAFNEASQAMSKTLTPQEVFDTVSEAFKSLKIGCIIYSIDEAKENLLIASFTYHPQAIKTIEKLVGLKVVGYSFPIEPVDIYRQVIRERKTIFAKDAEQALKQILPTSTRKFGEQIIKLINVYTSINAPLISQDEIIGLISVQSEELVKEDIPTITVFANQVAAVWHKAQLFQRAQEELQVRQAIEENLRASEERYRSIVYSSPMGMHLYSLEPGRGLVFVGSNPAADKILGEDNAQHIGKTIEEAYPQLAETEVPERYLRAAQDGEPWQTLQINYADEKISGAFEVHAVQTSPGKMAAIFLDVTERQINAQTIQQHANQLALLNKIGQQLLSVLDFEYVFDKAVELVQKSFGYHHVGIFTPDSEGQKVIMQARAGGFNDLFPSYHALEIGQGMVGWTFQNKQTLLSNDIAAEPQFVNLYPETLPTRSELCVPIYIGDHIIGVLDAQSPQKNVFDESDVTALETLAGQIAIAIENARLHRAVQNELEERQLAEAKLSESEERYRLLFERSSDAIFMFNPQTGQFLDANVAALQTIGRELKELKKLTLSDISPNSTRKYLEKLTTQNKAIDFGEVEYHRPDQTTRTALLSAVRVKENLAFGIAHDITESKLLNDAIQNIAAGVSATTGTEFFEKLTEYLATALSMRYAFVAELTNENHAQTRAFFTNGKNAENFEYQLANTPCADIVQQDICYFPQDIQKLYPLDLGLVKMEVESYAGTPLFNSSGQAIGILVIMDDKPLENPEFCQSLLQIFAVRGAAELERLQVEAELQRRANQLTTLNQIGQMITSSLNIEQVLDQVINVVPPLVDADGVSIILKDGPKEMVFAAASGKGAVNLKGQTIPTEAGIVGDVMANRRSVLVQNKEDQKRLYRDIEEISDYHTQSLLAVPLFLGEETIGVMEAVHTQENAFDADDLQIIETAGAWTSIAIANARQHATTERRLQETQALAAINQALNETQELDLLLQLIVDSINKTISNIERTVIHLYDKENDILIPTAVSGLELERKPFLRMQSNQGIAGEVIESGESINVRDTQIDERFVPIDGAYYLRSLLVVPVQSGGQRLGTISVSSAIPEAFSDQDEHLLTILGVQAALAIEGARLYTTTRRRLSETHALYSISSLIGQSPELEVEDILSQVVDLIWKEFGYYHVHVYLINQASGSLIANQGSGPIGAQLKEMEYQFKPEEGIVGYVATIGEPFMVNEVAKTHFYITNPLLPDIKAEFAAPLMARDQILGVLDIQHQAPNSFDDDDYRFLIAVADQLAIVLDKALLYRELETALEKEKNARDRLVQAEKLAAMGRLIASVAHELNNPLQAIQNALYLVKLEESLSLQAQDDLQVAINEGARMAGLIARLRDTYRPTTAADFQPASLNTLVEEVQKLINTHLRHNNVRMEFIPDEKLPEITIIRDQIKQVILNLCINGIESMPNGGELTVKSVYQGDDKLVLLHVIDTGAGFSPGTHSKIFEPFFTTKEGGTGLGLAVSYEIIQNHGGDITAENNPNEGGAIFTISLPLNTTMIE